MDRNRALEQVKANVFVGSNAAFLGCLLCGLTFEWSDKVTTAGVTDTCFYWNPEWFDSLTFDERKGVLLHELWHIALLHSLRLGSRNGTKWNVACDLRINANLYKEGVILPQGGLLDIQYADEYWSEERIYEDLPDGLEMQSWGSEIISNSNHNQLPLVQQAVTAAKFAGGDTGNLVNLLSNFLKPKLPWRQLLRNYLIERLNQDWNWKRPNKRFQDVYLPSLLEEDGGLISVAMFLDTSGSIEEEEIIRFVSEVKFIQENLHPQKLYLVQFDKQIKKLDVYTPNNPFKRIEICGYGGTSFKPVREFILKNKPTLSIIFTDLYATPMEPVGKNQVIWICSSNHEPALVGKTIYVN